MLAKLDRNLLLTIHGLFLALFFLLPLIFWIPNSEVFELPKMYFVYAMTALISGLWLARMVVRREIVVKRTPLDIPVLLFLISQIASTIYSIDPHVSWFGWYGRFNGGLWSTISYTLLYYAFLSNRFTIYDLPARNAFSIPASNALRSNAGWADAGGRFMNKTILFSALLVACYAILQRFGIDREFWVQDVMNRVFSTQGQPNWLASYLVMVIPIAIIFTNDKSSPMTNGKLARKSQPLVFIGVHWYIFVLIGIYFLALLWTKSRSGLLGFAVADVVFWILIFIRIKRFKIQNSRFKKTFLLIHGLILVLILITNNPARDFIFQVIPRPAADGSWESREIATSQTPRNDVILRKSEHGGTESGDIRKIVWSGALEIVKRNPIFGTGPETFGLTYWQIRPKEANLTSEWNFLYNKAHNEWLNLAANTGLFGLGAHLLLVGWFTVWAVVQIRRNKKQETRNNDKAGKFSLLPASCFLLISALSALLGIETINFFGFSTVTTETYRYLFMGIAVAAVTKSKEQRAKNKEQTRALSSFVVYCFLVFVFFLTLYLLSQISRLYVADLRYNLGRQFYAAGIVGEALKPLSQAVDLAPNEPVFRNELAESLSIAALSAWANGDKDQAVKVKNETVANFRIVSGQSKYNLIFTRTQAQMEFLMREIDPDLAGEALILAQRAIYLSPADPRGYYLLGRMYEELGDKSQAENFYRQALELKPDYGEAIKILNIE